MYTIEVLRNKNLLCIAGAADAAMLSGRVSVCIQESAPATLDVTGMNDLAGDRQSHTCWVDDLTLTSTDVLTFKFSEGLSASPPVTEFATDSEEHLLAQTLYREQLETHPLVPQILPHVQPNALLRLTFPGGLPVIATLEEGREFISFSLKWNRWRPERCHISVSSFSQQEALARVGSKAWFEGNLKMGESCVLSFAS